MSLRPTKLASDISAVWQPIPGTSQELALDTRCQHTLFTGSRGPGKCIPVDTPVPTPNGWKQHGDLVVGSIVFGANGKPTRVTDVYERQIRKVYRLDFNDGASVEASDNHLWSISIEHGTPTTWRTVDTDTIKQRVDAGFIVRLPPRPSVVYKDSAPLAIDPYILGAWVGDGSASVRVRQPTGRRTQTRRGYTVEFGSMDTELVAAFVGAGFSVKRTDKGFSWLVGKERHKDALMGLGLFGTKSATKFIPEQVMQGSHATRVAFLQGLADTDGTPRGATGARICTSSVRLAADVVRLVRSLGGSARVATYTPKAHHRQVLPIHNVDFSFIDIVPFRLSRKVAKHVAPERLGWFCPRVTAVTYVGEKEVSCVRVAASDSLYVVGADYIVTHNTDCQLMRFRRRVGLGYGAFWRGVIFDREHKNLDDLVAKSKRWFNEFNDGAVFLSATNAYKWVWPTGEELLFRTAKKEDDYWDYHGQEFPFIGWNELTKYPTGKLYSMFMSCNRSSWTQEKNSKLVPGSDGVYELPQIPLEVFSTTNPWGAGHAWVKAEFIDPAPYGVVVRKTFRVFDPGKQEDVDVERTQVAIFGSYRENKYLSPQYVATLMSEKDENLRKAWLQGSWDVAVGGAFSDVWNRNVHIVPRFKVPRNWRLDRTFDWGSTHPFWVGWWAEANGEEVQVTLPDGTEATFCPPPKSYVLVHEKYGTKAIGTNEGLKWSAFKIAEEVVRIEKELLADGWIANKVHPGPADNQITNKTQSDEETIAKKMEAKKVKWTKSDKSRGSRINGFQLMRDRLEAAVENSGPAVYTMVHNRASIALIPNLPRDPDNPDDVDTDSEDHPWDGWRYKLLSPVNRAATSLQVGFAKAR